MSPFIIQELTQPPKTHLKSQHKKVEGVLPTMSASKAR